MCMLSLLWYTSVFVILPKRKDVIAKGKEHFYQKQKERNTTVISWHVKVTYI